MFKLWCERGISSFLPRLFCHYKRSKQINKSFFDTYLDFHLVERFAVVNTNHATDHLWKNDHVPQMCFYNVGFLHWGSFLLRFSQSSHKIHRLSFESPRKSSPGTAVNQLHKLIMRQIKELVKVDTSIGELTKSPLLLRLFLFRLRETSSSCLLSSSSVTTIQLFHIS